MLAPERSALVVPALSTEPTSERSRTLASGVGSSGEAKRSPSRTPSESSLPAARTHSRTPSESSLRSVRSVARGSSKAAPPKRGGKGEPLKRGGSKSDLPRSPSGSSAASVSNAATSTAAASAARKGMTSEGRSFSWLSANRAKRCVIKVDAPTIRAGQVGALSITLSPGNKKDLDYTTFALGRELDSIVPELTLCATSAADQGDGILRERWRHSAPCPITDDIEGVQIPLAFGPLVSARGHWLRCATPSLIHFASACPWVMRACLHFAAYGCALSSCHSQRHAGWSPCGQRPCGGGRAAQRHFCECIHAPRGGRLWALPSAHAPSDYAPARTSSTSAAADDRRVRARRGR